MYSGVGDGTFNSASTYSTGNTPTGVLIVDVDADGVLDIVTCSNTAPGSSPTLIGELSFLRNNGAGFDAKIAYSNGGCRVLHAADLNNGGYADILSTNVNPPQIRVFLSESIGAATTSVPLGDRVLFDLSIGNTDPGTISSVAFSFPVPPELSFLSLVAPIGSLCTDAVFGTGIISLSAGTIQASPGTCTYRAVLAGENNGSPSTSVEVTSSVATAFSNTVALTVGAGSSAPSVALSYALPVPVAALAASSTIPSTGGQIYGTAVGDFNQDGILDVVTANDGAHKVTYHFGVGDGTFDAGTDMGSQGNNANSVAVADFNQDTWDDFAVVNRVSNNFVVFINDQLGGFQVGTQYNGVTTAGRAIETGDFNEGKEKLCGCICLIIVLRRFSRYCGC